MPKSIRFDRKLEENLNRAAQTLAMTHSEFIRDAVARRCDEVLGTNLYDALSDSLGSVKSDGGRAKHSGAAFRKLVRVNKR